MGKRDTKTHFLFCTFLFPLWYSPIASLYNPHTNGWPPLVQFALIVGCIVASEMIDCPCQEQNVKIHEIRVHSINNLSRVLLPPSPLFSLLPSLHSHSFVYVCARATNEISDAAMNSYLKGHPRVFCVPSQLCDKLPSLELIVTFSGSVYSFLSLYWFTSEPLKQSQTLLSPLRSLLRGQNTNQWRCQGRMVPPCWSSAHSCL